MANEKWEEQVARQDAIARRLEAARAKPTVIDARGVRQTKRVLESAGKRHPLTSLEVSILRVALEGAQLRVSDLEESLKAGGYRAPTAQRLRSVIGGLIHHLLTGGGVDNDHPGVAEWRRRVIEEERRATTPPDAEADPDDGDDVNE